MHATRRPRRYGHHGLGAILIEAGSDVNLSDRETGDTPLTLMCSQYSTTAGYLEHLAAVIQVSGAHVNVSTATGHTPLMLAAMHGLSLAIPTLIEHGARVDDVNSDGMSALVLAARDGHLPSVQALLDAGAHRSPKKTGCAAAAAAARSNGHTLVVSLLRSFSSGAADECAHGVGSPSLGSLSRSASGTELPAAARLTREPRRQRSGTHSGRRRSSAQGRWQAESASGPKRASPPSN